MPNPTAAILIIGDEILSGRTRDANMHYLAGELTRIGIDLKEVRVVADEMDAIAAAVNALRAGYTHVFTSGASARPMTTSRPTPLPGPSRRRFAYATTPAPSSPRITTARGWSSTPRASAWRAFPRGPY